MAGLLLGSCLARQEGLLGALKGPGPEHGMQRTASAFIMAAACDGLGPAAEPPACSISASVLGAVAAVSYPPRARTYSNTRSLTVPSYCLSGTKTRRRRSRRGSGGDDDELFGGGGDDGCGGDGGFWGGDGGGSGDDDSGDGSLVARLQDLLLLWSVFCALAFCQTVYHVSPKPKAGVAPAFAALSYSGIKARIATSQVHSSWT